MPFAPHDAPQLMVGRDPHLFEAIAPPAQDRDLLLAATVIVLATALFQQVPALVHQPHLLLSSDILYLHALLRGTVLLFGGLLVGWLVQPSAAVALGRMRNKLRPRTRRLLAVVSLGSCACLSAALLILFGRRQFGAWDFGILIETGYRQVLAQRPYLDFAAPTPPFFNWTAALAFRLFGVTWDATLYLAALFSMTTLVWSFALLRRLGLSSVAALGTSSVVQIAAMLTTAFWWYNNTTLILTGLFFLASMLLVRSPQSLVGQISFTALLALLPLIKPNIAGPAVAGSLPLVMFASRQRGRAIALTVAGFVGCVLLLHLMHVPVPAMLATYRGIARERGGLSTFGFEELSEAERGFVVLWTCALCSPLLLLLRPLRAALRSRCWKEACSWLFFPLASVVSLYGLLGNGEYRDVEFPPLLFAVALLAFHFRPDRPGMRRFTVALMCALAASDLYVGAARLRVYTIGVHTFFEWADDSHVFHDGFLNHLHGSRTLADTDSEVRAVVAARPGPVFLGPRLEFEYAALGLTSPRGWASFFQPGTAFDRGMTPALLDTWHAAHFQTLVFLKQNYPFYPKAFLRQIARDYTRDDHYKTLSVYRRRSGR